MLFAPKEKGQGLVEYAIILALIAIVVIAVMTTLGKKVNNTMSTMTMTSPSQKDWERVFSMRVCARWITEGNNSHHAVSMAGRAIPMMRRMKKMADMSAMGESFLV